MGENSVTRSKKEAIYSHESPDFHSYLILQGQGRFCQSGKHNFYHYRNKPSEAFALKAVYLLDKT